MNSIGLKDNPVSVYYCHESGFSGTMAHYKKSPLTGPNKTQPTTLFQFCRFGRSLGRLVFSLFWFLRELIMPIRIFQNIYTCYNLQYTQKISNILKEQD
jgi:hypothetical protein